MVAPSNVRFYRTYLDFIAAEKVVVLMIELCK